MSSDGKKSENNSITISDITFSLIDAMLLLGCTGIVTGIVMIFMSQENALYWSDFNFYHIMATLTKKLFLSNTIEFPLFVFLSTEQNYNFLYVIPLLPITLLFGDGRQAFIEALAVIYQLPYVILLSLLVTKVFVKLDELPKKYLFWLTVLLCLATPTIWAPTLRGYPDFGPASLVLLASLIYLNDVPLKQKKSILAIGLCLALAPIIRRHFFYLSFAQAAAMLIHQIYISKTNNLSVNSFCSGPLLKWICIGLTSSITLATVGFLFVTSIFKNSYFALYKSAYVPITEGLGYLISSYGVITFSLALFGLYLCSKYKYFNSNSIFLVSFSILSFLIWPVLGKHVAIHYTIYSNLFILLGITALVSWIISLSNRRLKSYLLAILVFFWSSNFTLGLSVYKESTIKLARYGMLTKALEKPNWLGRLFSANYGPIQRSDKESLVELFNFLKTETKGEKKIFIASDNGILGADILRNTQRELTGIFKAQALQLVEPPMLDSRDSLAIEGLLTSDYVLLCEPFKPMYKEKDSKDLKVVLDCFNQNWDFAKDFEKLPESFSLDSDSTVTIYRRIAPTSPEVAIKTFDRMKNFVEGELIGQPKWISTDEKYVAHDKQNKTTYLLGANQTDSPITHYLVSAKKVKGNFEIKGSIDSPSAQKADLQILALSLNKERVSIGKLIKDVDSFQVKGNVSTPSYLILALFTKDLTEKPFKAKNLAITE